MTRAWAVVAVRTGAAVGSPVSGDSIGPQAPSVTAPPHAKRRYSKALRQREEVGDMLFTLFLEYRLRL
jgi:hypothetical protein